MFVGYSPHLESRVRVCGGVPNETVALVGLNSCFAAGHTDTIVALMSSPQAALGWAKERGAVWPLLSP